LRILLVVMATGDGTITVTEDRFLSPFSLG
jgi:hypothetical protein